MAERCQPVSSRVMLPLQRFPDPGSCSARLMRLLAPSADAGLIGLIEFRVFGMGLREGMRPFQHGAVTFPAPDFQIVDADVAFLVERRHQKPASVGREFRHAVQRGAAAAPAVDQEKVAAFIIELLHDKGAGAIGFVHQRKADAGFHHMIVTGLQVIGEGDLLALGGEQHQLIAMPLRLSG